MNIRRRRASVTMMGGGGGGSAPLVYLLNDVFTTLDAAPVASPRTCEPGPGTLTLVQTDGEYAININGLAFPAQTSPTFGDQSAVGTELSRACGLAICWQVTINATNKDFWCGVNNDATPAGYSGVAGTYGIYTASSLFAFANGAAISSITGYAAGTFRFCTVLRGTGAWLYAKGGIFTEWTLCAVGVAGTGNVFPAISNYDQSGTVRYVKAAQLTGNFVTDYGFVTQRVASASAGQEITQTADGIIEATWTPSASGTDSLELEVRRIDDTHRLIVRCSQAASTIKLIKDDAGETELASAAMTWTAGTARRIVVRCRGDIVQIYVDATLKHTTTTSFNNAATLAKTSAAVTNFIAWPQSSAPEVAILESFFPLV